MNSSHTQSVRDFLKGLSSKDFLRIGMNEVAYVRPMSIPFGDNREKRAYAVYAADGTQLSVLETMDMAIATLRHNDLVAATLH